MKKLNNTVATFKNAVCSVILTALCFMACISGALAQGTPITPTAGYSNAVQFSFTGADQTFTVPPAVSSISVKIWGAGAGGSNASGFYGTGGSGGYVSGDINVIPGTVFSVMVGEGGWSDGNVNWNTRPYGFGGKATAQSLGSDGGGLSGIFTGTNPILSTDAIRAIMIAGGGGGGEMGVGFGVSAGGRGGDPTQGGGMPDFTGGDNTTPVGGGGGGGGYTGGVSIQPRLRYPAAATVTMGEGGANYLAPAVINGIALASADFVSPFNTAVYGLPPNTADPQYTTGIGRGTFVTSGKGGNGRVIIQYNTVLPLTLTSFNALRSGNHTLLNWNTASERNTSHFIIERSADNKTYLPVGNIAAAGNSNENLQYAFADLNPLPAINYYRLKMVDIDDKYTYSKVSMVNFASQAEAVSIWPNPVENTIAIDGLNPDMQIRIVSIDGKEAVKQAVSGSSLLLDITHLPHGLYFAEIAEDGIVSERLKFVKK